VIGGFQELFSTFLPFGGSPRGPFDVSANGQRLLMLSNRDGPADALGLPRVTRQLSSAVSDKRLPHRKRVE